MLMVEDRREEAGCVREKGLLIEKWKRDDWWRKVDEDGL